MWRTCPRLLVLALVLLSSQSVGFSRQDGAPIADAEATGVLAEFVHIAAEDVRVVWRMDRPEASTPDTEFGAQARHKAPSDSEWWGPRNADGTVECQFEVGRSRDTGEPYLRRADWTNRSRPAQPRVALEDVPELARSFLRLYCPFYGPELVLRRTWGFPSEGSQYGMTRWGRYSNTTALQIGLDVRLDDGSVSYTCWYRTGLTPATVTEEQARQIVEEQWRAKYPEQELIYERASSVLEAKISPTNGPVWYLTYRRRDESDASREGGTEHVDVVIDAVTGVILQAPNFTPPKLTREEAQRICDERWLAEWPDEKLVLVSSVAGLDRPESPSHGPVWHFAFRRTTEEALPVSGGVPHLVVQIDGLTGEILGAPNLTKPKLSETDAEQVVQGEWVAKHPDERLRLRSAKALLNSPKSPTHGPVWIFTFFHGWRRTPTTAPLVRDVDVTIDALTGEILEVPDLTTKEPKSMKP